MSNLIFEFGPIDQIFDDVAIPFEDWPREQREKALREAAQLQRKKREAAERALLDGETGRQTNITD